MTKTPCSSDPRDLADQLAGEPVVDVHAVLGSGDDSVAGATDRHRDEIVDDDPRPDRPGRVDGVDLQLAAVGAGVRIRSLPSSAEKSSAKSRLDDRLVEHQPGATGGELEVGRLDQPVSSQRGTGQGVLVEPVRVEHPVEGSDDGAGIDVDHPLLGPESRSTIRFRVVGGDAAPDEHPVAGGAEAACRRPSRGRRGG